MSRFPRFPASLLVLIALLAGTGLRAAEAGVEGLVDPTRPLFIDTQDDSGAGMNAVLDDIRRYEVSSILIRPDLQLAVVNSQRVRIGDEVGGARVLAIEPGRVTLEVNGEARDVKLHRNSIKTPASGSEGTDDLE